MTARSRIESLLKARKLDVTLTSTAPWPASAPTSTAEDLAATGVPAIDDALGGGLRRGHLSEMVGARSTGRTSVMCQALGAAVSRGELVALIDPCDRFDPASAPAFGLDLSHLLWVRDTGDAARAIKATNLVLQAGGFGLVVLDLVDVDGAAVRALPFTTWFRLSRVIEGSQTVALLLAAEHLARSAGGVTIALDAPTHVPRVHWTGRSHRARLLQGLTLGPRIAGGRG